MVKLTGPATVVVAETIAARYVGVPCPSSDAFTADSERIVTAFADGETADAARAACRTNWDAEALKTARGLATGRICAPGQNGKICELVVSRAQTPLTGDSGDLEFIENPLADTSPVVYRANCHRAIIGFLSSCR